eukprot:CAMPEP_0195014312 /NCGR_PEP_ID=MMETSP0326_2-20130528/15802_1 /TAXON_ID=2866 ORGANISM="Crypthecodinium cohnii, Strain Seligo" /NCGR_SAMPLE_ID=MMETSP0326_2 /ASSEMBLY_ACC=CAM_ASM_000348 /LENGTH=125 /DNA_ID=CAMNT_0040026679 /DNA_START=37 /DNA_END=411 /DNA_ORIENTATION=+
MALRSGSFQEAKRIERTQVTTAEWRTHLLAIVRVVIGLQSSRWRHPNAASARTQPTNGECVKVVGWPWTIKFTLVLLALAHALLYIGHDQGLTSASLLANLPRHCLHTCQTLGTDPFQSSPPKKK